MTPPLTFDPRSVPSALPVAGASPASASTPPPSPAHEVPVQDLNYQLGLSAEQLKTIIAEVSPLGIHLDHLDESGFLKNSPQGLSDSTPHPLHTKVRQSLRAYLSSAEFKSIQDFIGTEAGRARLGKTLGLTVGSDTFEEKSVLLRTKILKDAIVNYLRDRTELSLLPPCEVNRFLTELSADQGFQLPVRFSEVEVSDITEKLEGEKSTWGDFARFAKSVELKAAEFEGAGELEGAARAYEQATRFNPQSESLKQKAAEAYLRWAQKETQHGNVWVAENLYRRAYDLAPGGHWKSHQIRGEALMGLHQPAKAWGEFFDAQSRLRECREGRVETALLEGVLTNEQINTQLANHLKAAQNAQHAANEKDSSAYDVQQMLGRDALPKEMIGFQKTIERLNAEGVLVRMEDIAEADVTRAEFGALEKAFDQTLVDLLKNKGVSEEKLRADLGRPVTPLDFVTYAFNHFAEHRAEIEKSFGRLPFNDDGSLSPQFKQAIEQTLSSEAYEIQQRLIEQGLKPKSEEFRNAFRIESGKSLEFRECVRLLNPNSSLKEKAIAYTRLMASSEMGRAAASARKAKKNDELSAASQAYEKAAALYQKSFLLTQHPADAELAAQCFYAAGALALKKGDETQARDLFLKGVESLKSLNLLSADQQLASDPEALMMLGNGLREAGCLREAMQAYVFVYQKSGMRSELKEAMGFTQRQIETQKTLGKEFYAHLKELEIEKKEKGFSPEKKSELERMKKGLDQLSQLNALSFSGAQDPRAFQAFRESLINALKNPSAFDPEKFSNEIKTFQQAATSLQRLSQIREKILEKYPEEIQRYVKKTGDWSVVRLDYSDKSKLPQNDEVKGWNFKNLDPKEQEGNALLKAYTKLKDSADPIDRVRASQIEKMMQVISARDLIQNSSEDLSSFTAEISSLEKLFFEVDPKTGELPLDPAQQDKILQLSSALQALMLLEKKVQSESTPATWFQNTLGEYQQGLAASKKMMEVLANAKTQLKEIQDKKAQATQAKDAPKIAQLEKQEAQLREQLGEVTKQIREALKEGNRQFSEDYLTLLKQSDRPEVRDAHGKILSPAAHLKDAKGRVPFQAELDAQVGAMTALQVELESADPSQDPFAQIDTLTDQLKKLSTAQIRLTKTLSFSQISLAKNWSPLPEKISSEKAISGKMAAELAGDGSENLHRTEHGFDREWGKQIAEFHQAFEFGMDEKIRPELIEQSIQNTQTWMRGQLPEVFKGASESIRDGIELRLEQLEKAQFETLKYDNLNILPGLEWKYITPDQTQELEKLHALYARAKEALDRGDTAEALSLYHLGTQSVLTKRVDQHLDDFHHRLTYVNMAIGAVITTGTMMISGGIGSGAAAWMVGELGLEVGGLAAGGLTLAVDSVAFIATEKVVNYSLWKTARYGENPFEVRKSDGTLRDYDTLDFAFDVVKNAAMMKVLRWGHEAFALQTMGKTVMRKEATRVLVDEATKVSSHAAKNIKLKAIEQHVAQWSLEGTRGISRLQRAQNFAKWLAFKGGDIVFEGAVMHAWEMPAGVAGHWFNGLREGRKASSLAKETLHVIEEANTLEATVHGFANLLALKLTGRLGHPFQQLMASKRAQATHLQKEVAEFQKLAEQFGKTLAKSNFEMTPENRLKAQGLMQMGDQLMAGAKAQGLSLPAADEWVNAREMLGDLAFSGYATGRLRAISEKDPAGKIQHFEIDIYTHEKRPISPEVYAQYQMWSHEQARGLPPTEKPVELTHEGIERVERAVQEKAQASVRMGEKGEPVFELHTPEHDPLTKNISGYRRVSVSHVEWRHFQAHQGALGLFEKAGFKTLESISLDPLKSAPGVYRASDRSAENQFTLAERFLARAIFENPVSPAALEAYGQGLHDLQKPIREFAERSGDAALEKVETREQIAEKIGEAIQKAKGDPQIFKKSMRGLLKEDEVLLRRPSAEPAHVTEDNGRAVGAATHLVSDNGSFERATHASPLQEFQSPQPSASGKFSALQNPAVVGAKPASPLSGSHEILSPAGVASAPDANPPPQTSARRAPYRLAVGAAALVGVMAHPLHALAGDHSSPNVSSAPTLAAAALALGLGISFVRRNARVRAAIHGVGEKLGGVVEHMGEKVRGLRRSQADTGGQSSGGGAKSDGESLVVDSTSGSTIAGNEPPAETSAPHRIRTVSAAMTKAVKNPRETVEMMIRAAKEIKRGYDQVDRCVGRWVEAKAKIPERLASVRQFIQAWRKVQVFKNQMIGNTGLDSRTPEGRRELRRIQNVQLTAVRAYYEVVSLGADNRNVKSLAKVAATSILEGKVKLGDVRRLIEVCQKPHSDLESLHPSLHGNNIKKNISAFRRENSTPATGQTLRPPAVEEVLSQPEATSGSPWVAAQSTAQEPASSAEVVKPADVPPPLSEHLEPSRAREQISQNRDAELIEHAKRWDHPEVDEAELRDELFKFATNYKSELREPPVPQKASERSAVLKTGEEIYGVSRDEAEGLRRIDEMNVIQKTIAWAKDAETILIRERAEGLEALATRAKEQGKEGLGKLYQTQAEALRDVIEERETQLANLKFYGTIEPDGENHPFGIADPEAAPPLPGKGKGESSGNEDSAKSYLGSPNPADLSRWNQLDFFAQNISPRGSANSVVFRLWHSAHAVALRSLKSAIEVIKTSPRLLSLLKALGDETATHLITFLEDKKATVAQSARAFAVRSAIGAMVPVLVAGASNAHTAKPVEMAVNHPIVKEVASKYKLAGINEETSFFLADEVLKTIQWINNRNIAETMIHEELRSRMYEADLLDDVSFWGKFHKDANRQGMNVELIGNLYNLTVADLIHAAVVTISRPGDVKRRAVEEALNGCKARLEKALNNHLAIDESDRPAPLSTDVIPVSLRSRKGAKPLSPAAEFSEASSASPEHSPSPSPVEPAPNTERSRVDVDRQSTDVGGASADQVGGVGSPASPEVAGAEGVLIGENAPSTLRTRTGTDQALKGPIDGRAVYQDVTAQGRGEEGFVYQSSAPPKVKPVGEAKQEVSFVPPARSPERFEDPSDIAEALDSARSSGRNHFDLTAHAASHGLSDAEIPGDAPSSKPPTSKPSTPLSYVRRETIKLVDKFVGETNKRDAVIQDLEGSLIRRGVRQPESLSPVLEILDQALNHKVDSKHATNADLPQMRRMLLKAVASGYVDESSAREFAKYWSEKVKSRDEVRACLDLVGTLVSFDMGNPMSSPGQSRRAWYEWQMGRASAEWVTDFVSNPSDFVNRYRAVNTTEALVGRMVTTIGMAGGSEISTDKKAELCSDAAKQITENNLSHVLKDRHGSPDASAATFEAVASVIQEVMRQDPEYQDDLKKKDRLTHFVIGLFTTLDKPYVQYLIEHEVLKGLARFFVDRPAQALFEMQSSKTAPASLEYAATHPAPQSASQRPTRTASKVADEILRATAGTAKTVQAPSADPAFIQSEAPDSGKLQTIPATRPRSTKPSPAQPPKLSALAATVSAIAIGIATLFGAGEARAATPERAHPVAAEVVDTNEAPLTPSIVQRNEARARQGRRADQAKARLEAATHKQTNNIFRSVLELFGIAGAVAMAGSGIGKGSRDRPEFSYFAAVGNDPKAYIVLGKAALGSSSANIANTHCRIERTEDGIFLRQLADKPTEICRTDGTALSLSKRTDVIPVFHGDEVTLGNEITFKVWDLSVADLQVKTDYGNHKVNDSQLVEPPIVFFEIASHLTGGVADQIARIRTAVHRAVMETPSRGAYFMSGRRDPTLSDPAAFAPVFFKAGLPGIDELQLNLSRDGRAQLDSKSLSLLSTLQNLSDYQRAVVAAIKSFEGKRIGDIVRLPHANAKAVEKAQAALMLLEKTQDSSNMTVHLSHLSLAMGAPVFVADLYLDSSGVVTGASISQPYWNHFGETKYFIGICEEGTRIRAYLTEAKEPIQVISDNMHELNEVQKATVNALIGLSRPEVERTFTKDPYWRHVIEGDPLGKLFLKLCYGESNSQPLIDGDRIYDLTKTLTGYSIVPAKDQKSVHSARCHFALERKGLDLAFSYKVLSGQLPEEVREMLDFIQTKIENQSRVLHQWRPYTSLENRVLIPNAPMLETPAHGKAVFTIGRNSSSSGPTHIPVPDPDRVISRRHLQVERNTRGRMHVTRMSEVGKVFLIDTELNAFKLEAGKPLRFLPNDVLVLQSKSGDSEVAITVDLDGAWYYFRKAEPPPPPSEPPPTTTRGSRTGRYGPGGLGAAALMGATVLGASEARAAVEPSHSVSRPAQEATNESNAGVKTSFSARTPEGDLRADLARRISQQRRAAAQAAGFEGGSDVKSSIAPAEKPSSAQILKPSDKKPLPPKTRSRFLSSAAKLPLAVLAASAVSAISGLAEAAVSVAHSASSAAINSQHAVQTVLHSPGLIDAVLNHGSLLAQAACLGFGVMGVLVSKMGERGSATDQTQALRSDETAFPVPIGAFPVATPLQQGRRPKITPNDLGTDRWAVFVGGFLEKSPTNLPENHVQVEGVSPRGVEVRVSQDGNFKIRRDPASLETDQWIAVWDPHNGIWDGVPPEGRMMPCNFFAISTPNGPVVLSVDSEGKISRHERMNAVEKHAPVLTVPLLPANQEYRRLPSIEILENSGRVWITGFQNQNKVVLGRDGDVKIGDKNSHALTSRRHATIFRQERNIVVPGGIAQRIEVFLIEDGALDEYGRRIPSDNGTFVNRTRITSPQVLNGGDLIQLGEHQFIWKNPEDVAVTVSDKPGYNGDAISILGPSQAQVSIPGRLSAQAKGGKVFLIPNLIENGTLTIGTDGDVRIDDPARLASELHATLIARSEEGAWGYEIMDGANANGQWINTSKGTFVNGARLRSGEKRRLTNGDTITIGTNVFVWTQPVHEFSDQSGVGTVLAPSYAGLHPEIRQIGQFSQKHFLDGALIDGFKMPGRGAKWVAEIGGFIEGTEDREVLVWDRSQDRVIDDFLKKVVKAARDNIKRRLLNEGNPNFKNDFTSVMKVYITMLRAEFKKPGVSSSTVMARLDAFSKSNSGEEVLLGKFFKPADFDQYGGFAVCRHIGMLTQGFLADMEVRNVRMQRGEVLSKRESGGHLWNEVGDKWIIEPTWAFHMETDEEALVAILKEKSLLKGVYNPQSKQQKF